jgi:hypothetical protein
LPSVIVAGGVGGTSSPAVFLRGILFSTKVVIFSGREERKSSELKNSGLKNPRFSSPRERRKKTVKKVSVLLADILMPSQAVKRALNNETIIRQ